MEFAIDHEYDIYPQADTNERQKFDADFGHFAVTEYKRCRDKIYTTGVNKGKKHPNTRARMPKYSRELIISSRIYLA